MEATEQQSAQQARTATQQVLSTPELLENILFQLVFYDLLVNAHRVNRMFRSVIDSSPSIQKALFFMPAPNQIVPQPCPLLLSSKYTKFVDGRAPDAAQVKRDLRRQGNRRIDTWHEISGLKPYSRALSSSARKDAMGREDASWRKMLLVQPPIKETCVDSYKGWVVSDQWLRMGDISNNINYATCRHIAINSDGVGNLRLQYQDPGERRR